MFLYALFALHRIKNLLSFSIENINITNDIWLIPLVCLLLFFHRITKTHQLTLNRHNKFFNICILAYTLFIIIGGFNAFSISQYIYASLLFILPMFLFLPAANYSDEDIGFLFKLFTATCLIYALFAIILTTNFAYFMALVGNPVDDYRYYQQYRASMMIGSTITVSYFFNMTLPLCLYVFYSSKEKKWRTISALTIMINIIATFVLLSRFATVCTILILLYSFVFVRSNKNIFIMKTMFVILVIAAVIYAFKNYDLSRLMTGLEGDDSVSLRLTSAKLGIYIFNQYPLFGSGMGRYFERMYNNKYITVGKIYGLIDPHNMYILIMSELGILGFIITIALFTYLFRSFSYIKEKKLRLTAYITLIAFLFDAMGGSHLVNEISFAIIFWIYMGLFNAVSIRDRNKIGTMGKKIK